MSNDIKKQDVQAPVEKNIKEEVGKKIAAMTESNELFMPTDYSPENALKAAWLELQHVEDKSHNLALTVCTKPSIANALLDMVVQGLTPAKSQCYFVVYGKELTLMRSYMGTVSVAKRFSDVVDVFANVIYEGDKFSYVIDPETGLKKITTHEQSFENIDIDKIKGAYAVVLRKEADNYVEIMTMDQIKKAWNQGAAKGSSPAHKNFTDEMAKKTVINRACKMFINTSNDQPILAEAFNRTTENEYERDRSYAGIDVVDVEDEEINTAAEVAIFGDVGNGNDGFSEEEKKEIEAAEIKEAEEEAVADGAYEG